MLPAVPKSELVDALNQVVTSGWRLGDYPASRDRIKPLMYLAAAREGEFFPDVASRILKLLDASFERNAFEALGDHDKPLLSDEQSSALRILFGIESYYRDKSVDTRRIEAFALLMPEKGPDWLADTFYKTWQRPALELAITCLQASYGQEDAPSARRHESILRTASAIVGSNRRLREVVSVHESRSMLDRLHSINTRFNCLEHNEGILSIEFEPVSGVLSPEVITPQPWEYILRFPLSMPVYLGEPIKWSYRRLYSYVSNPPTPARDWISMTGNVRGYTVAVDVMFEGELPSVIWKFAIHTLRRPGSPEDGEIVHADSNGRVEFAESRDTRSDFSYGIAWSWGHNVS